MQTSDQNLEKPIRILLVDDDEFFRELLTFKIEEKLHQYSTDLTIEDRPAIMHASTGKEVLDLVKQNEFDLILLDINLPDHDGFFVCEQLQKHDELKTIPVIFITSYSHEESEIIRKCYAVGGKEYIAKNSSDEEIIARITSQIEIKRSRERIEIANRELAHKNSQLNDSIVYADRIQRALLSSKELMEASLPEHFVFYSPKDVISGDFYLTVQTEGKTYVAIADCTGHGVPGAMMSMLGVAFLKEVISGERRPDLILNKLRERLKQELNPVGLDIKINDGMDLALLCFDFETMTLTYASAYRPVIIVRNNQLFEYKGDRFSVGNYQHMDVPFSLGEIKLQKDDCIYSYTDGFADQFGGPLDKKFMTRNLKQLILDNHTLPMDSQMAKFEQTFVDWKGNAEQTDDVLLLGMRL